MQDELTTQEKLLKIGKEEFLEKGFKDASLREIAKKAGYTLGAFYGYYDSKEALFEAIVGEPAEALYGYLVSGVESLEKLPEEAQTNEMENTSRSVIAKMLDLIYKDMSVFKLLFFRAAGTKYEDYLQRFIDLEIKSTYHFIEVIRKQGHSVQIDDELIHILASAMFSGMMEVIDHDMRKGKAVGYISQLQTFYTAGWHKILGL